jgi:hypothetical protein
MPATATDISGYTRHDVVDDRIRFGEFATDGHYFYDRPTDAIYQLDTDTSAPPHDTFLLAPCNEHQPNGDPVPTPDAPDTADNICALAGEIELGRLTPLPDFTVRTTDDEAFLSLGVFVLRLPADSLTDALRAWTHTNADHAQPATDIDSNRVIANATTAIATNDDTTTDLTMAFPAGDRPDCVGATPATSTTNPTPASAPDATEDTKRAISAAEDTDLTTRFIPCPQFSKWTFDLDPIRNWVEAHLDGRTLNACAGTNRLRQCRNPT